MTRGWCSAVWRSRGLLRVRRKSLVAIPDGLRSIRSRCTSSRLMLRRVGDAHQRARTPAAGPAIAGDPIVECPVGNPEVPRRLGFGVGRNRAGIRRPGTKSVPRSCCHWSPPLAREILSRVPEYDKSPGPRATTRACGWFALNIPVSFQDVDLHATRLLPRDLWRGAQRKLKALDVAARLDDLRIPAGNRLERLKGSRSDQHSIRINDRYRVAFRWENGHAYEVGVEDYH